MTSHWRLPVSAALALTLAAWPAADAWAQGRVPTSSISTADIVRAVQANPVTAPQVTAEAVAAGNPENAGAIVGAVVGALQPTDRRALSPQVVTSAIAALPAGQRTAMAASCACAAIRAVPTAEQSGVVPAIISAAVTQTPQARNQILTCALDAAPALVAAINAAVSSPGAQSGGGAPASGILPGGGLGIESTLPANQTCASPPCPG